MRPGHRGAVGEQSTDLDQGAGLLLLQGWLLLSLVKLAAPRPGSRVRLQTGVASATSDMGRRFVGVFHRAAPDPGVIGELYSWGSPLQRPAAAASVVTG